MSTWRRPPLFPNVLELAERVSEDSAAASSGSCEAVPEAGAAEACLATHVRSFYLRHNPEKADGAAKVARRYVGFPHVLSARLAELYGVGLGPSVPALIERIESAATESASRQGG